MTFTSYAPRVLAAGVLAGPGQDDVTLSIWADLGPGAVPVEGALRLAVLPGRDGACDLVLAVPGRLVRLALPPALVDTLAAIGRPRLVLAVSAGPAPARWWERPFERADLLVGASAASWSLPRARSPRSSRSTARRSRTARRPARGQFLIGPISVLLRPIALAGRRPPRWHRARRGRRGRTRAARATWSGKGRARAGAAACVRRSARRRRPPPPRRPGPRPVPR